MPMPSYEKVNDGIFSDVAILSPNAFQILAFDNFFQLETHCSAVHNCVHYQLRALIYCHITQPCVHCGG